MTTVVENYAAHVLAYRRHRAGRSQEQPIADAARHQEPVEPSPRFSLSQVEWLEVDKCLMKAQAVGFGYDEHVRDYNRDGIEMILQSFVWPMVRTDSRSSETVDAMACHSRLARHLRGALAELAKMEAMPTQPIKAIWFAIHDDPFAQPANYLAWKAKIEAAANYATRAAQGYAKSTVWIRDEHGKIAKDENGRPIGTKPGSNKARGDLVDQLFEQLRDFWIKRGGKIGKSVKSPSTRFAKAAAGRIISETAPDVKMPSAFVAYVRSVKADRIEQIEP